MNKLTQHIVPYRFWPSTLIRRWIERRSGGEVISGPFLGMKYVKTSVCSEYEPKLLGTYELELNTVFKQLISHEFQTIVDVGAAEGYYAVGLARQYTDCHVVAFEANEHGRELLEQMALLNGVRDRMRIRGFCDSKSLGGALLDSGRTLVIMDVEGGEKLLLDPVMVPELLDAHIIVEIHDFVDSELGKLILHRFKDSHHIQDISIKERSLNDYPFEIPALAEMLFRNALLNAISEKRHHNSRWFHMMPRDSRG
jgi:hypothetical protein